MPQTFFGPPKISFDVSDWYWRVGADTTRFYSSKTNSWVEPNDEQLAAFLERGGRVTNIISIEELDGVLVPRGQPPVPSE